SEVKKHLLSAFAVLGVPKEIKTDNGPAYTSKPVEAFLQEWGISHVTGMSYSPTGQAVVERTHQT
ncbi:POK18 protein, partial [Daphoenositta chrysoptera]|nr:POK18 protein [Daphoenositta chrysoptera]